MRRIRINFHDPKQDVIVTEQNKKNVSVVDDVLIKRKIKRQKSDVDINSNSWGVVCWVGFSSKHEPIGIVRNAYQRNAFTVFWTGNRPNSCPRRFLNEDNVKVMVNFEDQVDNEIILLNILWKDFQVFQNHISIVFTIKRVEFLLVSLSLVYSLVCYSLLNQYL